MSTLFISYVSTYIAVGKWNHWSTTKLLFHYTSSIHHTYDTVTHITPTTLSHTSHLQHCHTHHTYNTVTHITPTTLSHTSHLQHCHTHHTYNTVTHITPTTLSHTSHLQHCPSGVDVNIACETCHLHFVAIFNRQF